MLALAGLVSPHAGRERRASPALGLAIATTASALALTTILHGGSPLSCDEVMAVLDSTIVRGIHLIAPAQPEWCIDLPALAPHFLLPVPGNVA